MYVKTIYHLSDGQESKNNLQFMIRTSMTLKQGQGHQTWYTLTDPKHLALKQSQGQPTFDENVDPKKGNNLAKSERSRFNSA